MNKKNLEEICRQSEMPICIQQAPIIKKTELDRKMYFIDMPHLQTNKHRFRTYPKPISKIVSL
jgi:hypothetical protein